MVPEAPLEQTEHGLVPAGRGWFVLNARDARWFDTGGRGKEPTLQGRGDFPQVGLGLTVLEPGEPMAMYHWETDQEDFLVLAGEAVLIVEGEERPLRQWDFVHCPPETQHVIVGAGDGPCIVFAVGALENHTFGSRVDGTLEGTDDWGAYTVDEAALRHGAGVEEETDDATVAYARFPELVPTRYRDGWLPSSSKTPEWQIPDPLSAQQLSALGEVGSLLDRSGLESWLFGGWGVDFHVGAVTREHDDIDLAVWLDDAHPIGALLEAEGWRHAPARDEDGGTRYERGGVRLELTYLTRDDAGRVFVPLRHQNVLWSEEPFGTDERELLGVRSRVLSLALLKHGKSSERDDPDDAAKDRADFQALSSLSP